MGKLSSNSIVRFDFWRNLLFLLWPTSYFELLELLENRVRSSLLAVLMGNEFMSGRGGLNPILSVLEWNNFQDVPC